MSTGQSVSHEKQVVLTLGLHWTIDIGELSSSKPLPFLYLPFLSSLFYHFTVVYYLLRYRVQLCFISVRKSVFYTYFCTYLFVMLVQVILVRICYLCWYYVCVVLSIRLYRLPDQDIMTSLGLDNCPTDFFFFMLSSEYRAMEQELYKWLTSVRHSFSLYFCCTFNIHIHLRHHT